MLAEKERMSGGWLLLIVSLQYVISSSWGFCQPMGTLVGAWGLGLFSYSHEAGQGLLSPHQEKGMLVGPLHQGGRVMP